MLLHQGDGILNLFKLQKNKFCFIFVDTYRIIGLILFTLDKNSSSITCKYSVITKMERVTAPELFILLDKSYK